MTANSNQTANEPAAITAEQASQFTARQQAAVARLIAAGVTIYRPETCVIDPEVEVAAGTIIEAFAQLLGRTRVGAGCRIRSFSVIENCTLGNGVEILQSCVLEDSVISNGARLGPFTHLRPGNEVGENAHVGNFVEMKKSRLGKGAKANHLTYLGDAEVGEAANIGAGTITCNYDGVNKNVTRIGKGAFVGSDTTLVAPVTVGDGAYIGAGSCVTKDVPADALAVSRAKQVNIEGWAKTRRAKREAKKP
jgi:bifunctional UDP-N-acetylglucosamine pyrophosphorylase / glucosamine-1-phosphate N-acetyltransferase